MIQSYLPPGGPGVRVDSHIYAGYTIPPYYDSLLSKVIAWGANREEAIVRMQRAMDECVIGGVKTTLPVLRRILAHPDYRQNNVSTNFVEEQLPALIAE
jgi:acetyl-CoA carboxylase biotin carboxylase subunit